MSARTAEAQALISIWHYVDPTLITQHTPDGQVPNELEAGAEMYQIDTPGRRTPASNHDEDGTPRSGIPSDITTYMWSVRWRQEPAARRLPRTN